MIGCLIVMYLVAAVVCGVALIATADVATGCNSKQPVIVWCFIITMAMLWPTTLLAVMYDKALSWQEEQRKEGP